MTSLCMHVQIRARSAKLVEHSKKRAAQTQAIKTAKEQYEMLAEVVRAEAIDLKELELLQDEV